MHGRPKLGKHRMVTVATRVEPDEVDKLKALADECGLSLCGYMRELIRLELGRASRTDIAIEKQAAAPLNGSAGIRDAAA